MAAWPQAPVYLVPHVPSLPWGEIPYRAIGHPMADHANHMDATTLQGPNPGVVPPGHQDLTGRWEFHEYSNLFDDPFSPPPQAGVVVPPSRLTRYVHAAGGFAVWVSEFDIPTAPHPISLSEAIPMEVSTEEEPQPTDSQIMALLKVDTDCKRDAFQAWREQVRAERARAPLPEAECPICCESVHGRLFKQCPHAGAWCAMTAARSPET